MSQKNQLLMDRMQAHLQTITSKEHLSGEFNQIIQILNTYNAAIKETQTKLEILNDEFQSLHDHNPIHHMESRLKTPTSIYFKIQRKGLELTLRQIRRHITDIAGVRVICPYIEDIYKLAELLIAQCDIELVAKKDYIEQPKPNGYRSLHLIVKIPVLLSTTTEHVPVEIQIRTIAMDMWASLEHEMRYKRMQTITPELILGLKECADTIAEVDQKMQAIYHRANQDNQILKNNSAG